jgi:4a-hydroxytetrahydrobiopterin dehydratase
MSLRAERCEACTRDTPLVGSSERPALLAELHAGWEIAGERLRRTVVTADFAESLSLAVHCGMIAEAQGHHPDLTVRWGHLDVEVWTHVAGGLTRTDFVLAAHLDAALDG